MNKFPKKLNVFIFIVLTAIVILISEGIFYYNNPQHFLRVGILTGKLVGKTNKEFANYVIGSNLQLILNQNKLKYPEIIPSEFKISFQNSVIDYTDPIFVELTKKSESKYINESDLSKYYYDIALSQYASGNNKDFEVLLRHAFYLNPTLSYWPIELANFQYLQGRVQDAKDTLMLCMKTPEPNKHCQIFLEQMELSIGPNEPGFLRKEIEEYFKNN